MSDETLTFAEAMALDPSGVEADVMAPDGPRWARLDEDWIALRRETWKHV